MMRPMIVVACVISLLALSELDAKVRVETGLQRADGPTSAQNRSSITQLGVTPDEKEAAVKAIVEKYWSDDGALDRYSLLAESYKLNLAHVAITNAVQYANATQPPERVWGTRTYQKVDLNRDTRQRRDVAQVTVIINWEQEGYRGLMTYIFDLVVEGGRWRIANIMH